MTLGKHRKRHEDVESPTPAWMAKRAMKGDSPDAAIAGWKAMTRRRRQRWWKYDSDAKARIAAAVAKVAAGTADARAANYATRGGYRAHASKEDAAAAREEEGRIAAHRKSQDTLEFRLQHAKGCSVEGCPLAPPKDGEPLVPLRLLEHDHVDQATKVAKVTTLKGNARAAELEKTQCMCMWHHFLRTREQRGHRPVLDPSAIQRRTKEALAVAMWKERVHCEHPLHGSMPYASLVPSASDDPLMYGFLHASHVMRGGLHNTNFKRRSDTVLSDLASGAAVVHCKFCHALWTLAEDAQLADTPLTQHQYGLLPPAFVEHFKEKTAGFDWEAERIRICARTSNGLLAANRRKKRKREEKEQNEEEGENEESEESGEEEEGEDEEESE